MKVRPDQDGLARSGIRVLTVAGAGHLMAPDAPDTLADALLRAGI